jgi:hypothetical protein
VTFSFDFDNRFISLIACLQPHKPSLPTFANTKLDVINKVTTHFFSATPFPVLLPMTTLYPLCIHAQVAIPTP